MDKFILKPAPTTEVDNTPLPANVGARLKATVEADALNGTIALAYAFTRTKVSTTSMNVSGPFHTPGSIQEKMQADADGTITAWGHIARSRPRS